MSKHRILMVLDHAFPPDARVENEAVSLINAGYEVFVLAIGPDARPTTETYRGIHIVRDKVSGWFRDKMRGLAGTVPILTWYLARRIIAFATERPIEVLHMHDLYLFGGGLRAGEKLGIRVVGDLHENWVEALKHYAWSTNYPGKLVISIPRWERLEKRWVNAVDRCVVVIEEAEERNITLGVSPEKITVVPNTIKHDDFDSYDVDHHLIERIRSDLTITYTGGFDVHRGLVSLIEAMPIILAERPEARLVLVGDGRIRSDLESLVRRKNLASQVWFEGWQAQPLIKSYISGSDICLVPHLKTVHTDATIPHKLFHYMYLEKPVVVSDCRPLRRIVHETNAGLVFRAGDAASLAANVLELASRPDRMHEMGMNGHRAIVQKYNWTNTVQGLIQMYAGLF